VRGRSSISPSHHITIPPYDCPLDASHRILITAGPTHEPIDAVRYIANRSSGRLGIALAEEAANRGLQTTLLLGPTHLEPQAHSYLKVARFRTAADLQRLLRSHWPEHDTLIMAAAVADYRPRSHVGSQSSEVGGQPNAASRGRQTKIPRTDQPLTLELEPTPDLLAEVSTHARPDQRLVGFALEPVERLLESARSKLARKRIDVIVANPLETMDDKALPAGATVVFCDGREIEIAPMSKREFARRLMDILTQAFSPAREAPGRRE
jgi:phosphopantothenoylcysteine decarboxylase / phosphopantothenate---cysteine ligase